MIRVVIKTLAKPFYIEHAGFFFLLFFIAGGFMRSTEHIAMATFIADSNSLTIILLIAFSLYHLKLTLFTKSILNSNPYLFLRNLTSLLAIEQFLIIGLVFCILSIVPLIYAVFITFFMIKAEAYMRLGFLHLYFVLSASIYCLMFVRQLQKPLMEQKASVITNFIHVKVSRPFIFWFPTYLINKRPLLLISTKLISTGLLVLIFSGYNSHEYDWRYLGMGAVITSNVNMVVAYAYFEFYTRDLSFLRGMPISVFKRLCTLLTVTILLLLPEAIVILRKMPLDDSLTLSWQIISFSLLNFLFFVHLAIYKNASIEYIGKACLFITLLQIYLVLFNVPFFVLSLLMILPILYVQSRYHLIHDY